jgi:hypothetical protein
MFFVPVYMLLIPVEKMSTETHPAEEPAPEPVFGEGEHEDEEAPSGAHRRPRGAVEAHRRDAERRDAVDERSVHGDVERVGDEDRAHERRERVRALEAEPTRLEE